MAYTVLARKYRSQTLEDVIGQPAVATTLANAIRMGRIHHGYLFTGTRGVGKTSVARILAKCLNCQAADAPTVTPCCKCESCLAVAEGQDIDVVEIDAASNTGVDNIRELRSNAAYRPARSRFKVYIIDEVHMLSTGAFNALLKTLEEPPGHVKFILATTEIQKVPATIQSRCQRFNFRNISPDDIAGRLAFVAREEGAATDDAVVRRVARLANGSMRDALSILDQLLAVSPKALSAEVLDEVLPPAQDEQVFELLTHAAEADAAATLRCADQILSGGRGLDVFCNDLIETVRSLMLLRACGADSDVVDFPAGNRAAYARLSTAFELSQYVQMIGMLEELRRNVRFSSAGRALADAAVVRLARMKQWSSIEALLVGGADGGAGDEKKKSGPPVAASEAGRRGARGGAAPNDAPVPAAPPPAALPPRSAPRSQVEPAPLPAMRAAAPAAETVHAGPRTAVRDAERQAASSARRSGDRPSGGQPVSAEERMRIQADPVVQQVLELFQGTIVNIERPQAATARGDANTED